MQFASLNETILSLHQQYSLDFCCALWSRASPETLLAGVSPSIYGLLAAYFDTTPRSKETSSHRNGRRDRQSARGVVAAVGLGFAVPQPILDQSQALLRDHHGTGADTMQCSPCGPLFDQNGNQVYFQPNSSKGDGRVRRTKGKGKGKQSSPYGAWSNGPPGGKGQGQHWTGGAPPAPGTKVCTYCQSVGFPGLGHLEPECRR